MLNYPPRYIPRPSFASSFPDSHQNYLEMHFGARTAPIPFSLPSSRSCLDTLQHDPQYVSPSSPTNEHYESLVDKGFGSPFSGESFMTGSEDASSARSDTSWRSPAEPQHLYVNPNALLESSQNIQIPIPPVHSQSKSQRAYESDDEASISSPMASDRGPRMAPAYSPHPESSLFHMDLDDPSSATTAGEEEDTVEEETIDEEILDSTLPDDDLDTSVDYYFINNALDNPHSIDDYDVTLTASKTPCLDALAFCVVLRLGAFQNHANEENGTISVTNFFKFLNGIHSFCPKKAQTQNDEARIKALKRWFDGIPVKRKRDQFFVMQIKRDKVADVQQIIRKLQRYCISHGFVPAMDPHTQQVLTSAGYGQHDSNLDEMVIS